MNEIQIFNSPGWADDRKSVAFTQAHLDSSGFDPGPVDGLLGPATAWAMDRYATMLRGDPDPVAFRDELPDDDDPDALRRAYGEPGDESALRRFALPYPMALSWDLGTSIREVRLHRDAGESFTDALARVLALYPSAETRRRLGLDLFGGGFNDRAKRGGTAKSTHAWGIAVDFDPVRNPLRAGADSARLARPDASDFWDTFEEFGWRSLGRMAGFDWMHAQRALA